MQKHSIDFVIGLVLGLAFFFGTLLIFDKNPLFLEPQYYLLSVLPFLFIVVTPHFRNRLGVSTRKNIFIAKSLLAFLLGYFLPTLTWALIVYRAISNWTLF